MDNTYRTSDFNLATYLYAKWLELKTIETGSNSEKQRCTFVFSVPEQIDFIALLEMRSSPATEFFRNLLFKSKLLKNELKKHFNR